MKMIIVAMVLTTVLFAGCPLEKPKPDANVDPPAKFVPLARFVIIEKVQDSQARGREPLDGEIFIMRDTETGRDYLVVEYGYQLGITPLLGSVEEDDDR